MISGGRALLIAWGCVALTVVCVPLASVLISNAQPGSLGIAAELRTPFPWVGILAFAFVGALIVSHHPDQAVGWIFCLSGFSAAACAVAEAICRN